MRIVELELANSAVSVDATLLATELGLTPSQVLESVRRGQLTSLCEQGIDEDAGRFRLTFYHGNRRLQLIVDQDGRLLGRSAVRSRRRPTLGTKAPAR